MAIKISNFASATLQNTITSGDTSIVVSSGGGALFPTLSAGDYCYITLQDNLNNFEIVKATARTGDTFTVTRAQEGTSARAFTAAVTIVALRLTAQTFLDLAYSTTDSSASSVLIGTGSKTFTVSSGKNFSIGMYLIAADNAAPTTNSMYGQVSSYSGTTLIIDVTNIKGSGTKTAWTISMATPGGFGTYASAGANADISSITGLTGEINFARDTVAATATTTPLWASGAGNLQDWTGTPTITNFPAAPNAGCVRYVYPATGTVITDNANIDVQGGATYTTLAGDKLTIEAITTTTFKVWIDHLDGTAVKDDDTYLPSNAQNGSYQLVLTDAGKYIYSENTGAQTITVPTNATTAFPLGSTISIVNNGTTNITFTTTGLTVYKAGTYAAWGSGGTLSVSGLATLLKVATDTWFISGAGLS